MSTTNPNKTRGRGAALLATALLVFAVASAADAALTTPSCLAKKLKEWGNLRKCQAGENGKALQAKPFDLAKCQTKFNDKLAKLNTLASAAAIACRYGVNGGAEAGTVTDYDTGLQWEQKTDDTTVHDKDNVYTWCAGVNCTNPDGTAFTAFLGTLNNGTSGDGSTTSGCFTGHCDWRLPAIGELAGIVDATQGFCGGGAFGEPCIDQTVFGPTNGLGPFGIPFWSASTGVAPTAAWRVDLSLGTVGPDLKAINAPAVRAVRSGL